MLNKTDISNQITGLRPKVKQAAVHLAHHLTKEITKCQGRKGPKAEKFHKKAETHRKEVLLLKKIHADSVSRYALSMDFNEREKLLGDINLPLETKVIVKLATHSSVVSHIKSFREKHPEWKSKLPNLLENLGIRARFKKKIEKEQEKQKRKLARKQATSEASSQDDEDSSKQKNTLKAQKSSKKGKSAEEEENNSNSENSDSDSDNTQSNDDENLPEIHNDRFDNCSDKSGEDEEEEDIEGDDDAEEDSEGDDDEAEEDSEGDNEEEENDDDDEDDDNDTSSNAEGSSESEDVILSDIDDIDVKDPVKNIKFDTSTKKDKKSKTSRSKLVDLIPKTSGNKFAEVRRFSDLLEEKRLCMGRKGPESKSLTLKDEKPDNEPVEEDTFFMTGENSFLKTTVVKRGDGEGLESSSRDARNIDEEANQWSVNGKMLKGNRAERRAKFLGKDLRKKKPRQMDKSKDFTRLPQREQKNGDSFNKFRLNMKESVDGKGFKHKQFDNRPKNGNISNSSKQDAPSAGETLHPSWEAKRKQKVSLDNFQGKKIKFDDN